MWVLLIVLTIGSNLVGSQPHEIVERPAWKCSKIYSALMLGGLKALSISRAYLSASLFL